MWRFNVPLGPPMQNRVAHLALLAVALIYGANYSIAKIVLDGDFIGPLGFILLRVIAATALFWLSGIARPTPAPEKGDLARLVLCGFLGVAANQMLFFSGLDRTTPIHASLIMVLTPLLVYLLSAWIAWKPLSRVSGMGVLLAGAGAVWLMAYDADHLGAGDWVGDVMVSLNATCYALYLILVRPLMAKYEPMFVLKWVFLFGSFFVIFFGWKEFAEIKWATFTLPVYLSIAYVLIFTTFVAYSLNAFALKKVAAVTVSIYIYLQPLFAAIIAIVMGKDSLDINKLIAAAAIFTGVWMATFRTAEKQG
jgi:drug/metabolite transporter (DMT)-like permease